MRERLLLCYFFAAEGASLLVEALVLFFCFFTFFVAFLVVAVLFWLGLLLLPEVAGCCAAKVSGIVATASPTASNVFFMVRFLPRTGFSLPVHSFIMRPAAQKLDSLGRLSAAPNSGAIRLTFIRLCF
jgi:hypothetical protein